MFVFEPSGTLYLAERSWNAVGETSASWGTFSPLYFWLDEGFELLLEPVEVMRAVERGVESEKRDDRVGFQTGQPLIRRLEMTART